MDLNTLNEMQRKAVTTTDGALLVLAGAGSGKTRVLTYRIAYMVKECGISPFSILALTFTNKAAREMKERTEKLLGNVAQDMWISTFHSSCARILRIDGEAIGLDRNFTIYDDAERKEIIAPVMTRLGVDEKQLSKSAVLHMISDAKNHSTDPLSYLEKEYPQLGDDILVLYKEYEKGMRTADALDFDDLILKTTELLSRCPDKLEKYRRKFEYVLIDEYQDTNMPQYELVQLICKAHGNICVVGDDDQSIYGWRGADIRNILEFEKDFPGAQVIRLEQNYRSTGNILDAANSVIANNIKRKGKNLWTSSGRGEPVTVYAAYDERDEANYIAGKIEEYCDKGARYNEFAILYRTNAQSRVIESVLLSYGIRYRVFGGQRFYDRKEIKDIMAYLRLIANPNDNAAFKRIINVPKRSIGAKTIENLEELSYSYGVSMMNYLLNPMLFGTLPAAAQKKLEPFVNLYMGFANMRREGTPSALAESVINDTGYRDYLMEFDSEYEARCQNIDELTGVITEIEESADDGEDALLLFLENAALATDMDDSDESDDYVSVMTLHSAKGLEFSQVFIAGVEDGLFPSVRSMESEERLEEERRLCYVGITRARKRLYLIHTQMRRLYNNLTYSKPSRFLEEIPENLLRYEGVKKKSYSFGNDTYSHPAQKPAQRPPQVVIKPQAAVKPGLPPKPVQNEDAGKLQNGMRVSHPKFGQGTVTAKTGSGNAAVLTVEFDNGEVKKLAAAFAPLTIVNN